MEKGDGFVRVYPFLEETPSLRNAVSHLEDCRNAVEKGVPVYEVKGPSVLQTVPTFDPVNSLFLNICTVCKEFAEACFLCGWTHVIVEILITWSVIYYC